VRTIRHALSDDEEHFVPLYQECASQPLMAEPGDPAGLLKPAPHLLTNYKTRLTTTETRIIEAIGT
jgi:hypothetical protein